MNPPIRFNNQSVLNSLSADQQEQLYDWLECYPAKRVLELVAAEPPEGFGLKIHLTTLRRFHLRARDHFHRQITEDLPELGHNAITNEEFVFASLQRAAAELSTEQLTPNRFTAAARAETQLAGELKPEGSDTAYLNELDFTGGGAWKGAPIIEPGVINWFELAPDSSTPINFPADKPFPGLDPSINQGLVAEITTYLDLTAGNHTLGLYSEGGHKVTAGFAPNSPVIALFDNSGNVQRIPTYFARSQFFDVVAPVAGLYPIRILWFQNRRSQEPGVLLEFFSVKDRALHLVNDSSDPLSIKAYRSALPPDPNTERPTLSITSTAGGVSVSWTGNLQAAETLQGQWQNVGAANQSPMTFQTTGRMRFFRATR